MTLTAMLRMLERVVLQTNLSKTKEMVCNPGFIWGQQGESAYKHKVSGEGPTLREHKKTRVSCKE